MWPNSGWNTVYGLPIGGEMMDEATFVATDTKVNGTTRNYLQSRAIVLDEIETTLVFQPHLPFKAVREFLWAHCSPQIRAHHSMTISFWDRLVYDWQIYRGLCHMALRQSVCLDSYNRKKFLRLRRRFVENTNNVIQLGYHRLRKTQSEYTDDRLLWRVSVTVNGIHDTMTFPTWQQAWEIYGAHCTNGDNADIWWEPKR
jgi:hypothetical protein